MRCSWYAYTHIHFPQHIPISITNSLKLTKLRYWPWNNFEVRLCEGWDPRESKDFIRWDEGRAHTESLPSPMSEKVVNREKRELRCLIPRTLTAHQTLNWGSHQGTHRRPPTKQAIYAVNKAQILSATEMTCTHSPITFPEINWRQLFISSSLG